MASGSWEFGTANKYITGRISWQAYADNATNNRSHVYVQLAYKKSSSSTSSTKGTVTGYICGNYYNAGSRTLSCNNAYQDVASIDYWVGHNADGSGGCTISGSGGISGTTFSSSSTSGWIGFDKIARYFSSTPSFSYSSRTSTSITYNWSTSETCNYINLFLNGGSTAYTAWSGSAKSGSITVSGLVPSTGYTAKISARRSDSGLWSNSGTTSSNSTLPKQITISSCSPETLEISNNMSVSCDLGNYGSNGSSYIIKCEYKKDDGSWIEFINSDGSIATGSVDVDTGVYTFSFGSFYNEILGNCKTKFSTELRITCTSNNVATTALCNLYIPDYELSWDGIALTDSVPKPSGVSSQLTSGVLIQNKGNLRVSTTAYATSMYCADISLYQMTITNITTTNIIRTGTVFDTEKTYDVGALNEVGTLSVLIVATDSRGKSITSTKTIQSLQYSSPVATFSLKRQNDYESKILMKISGNYSRLYYNNVNANSITAKYRYKETVSASYGEYTNIPVSTGYITLSTSGSATQGSISYSRDSDDTYFLNDIDSQKSFLFEFVITDSYGTNHTTAIQINEGIPLMGIMNNGNIIVGCIPNSTILEDTTHTYTGTGATIEPTVPVKGHWAGDIQINTALDGSGTYVGESIAQLRNGVNQSQTSISEIRQEVNTLNDDLSKKINDSLIPIDISDSILLNDKLTDIIKVAYRVGNIVYFNIVCGTTWSTDTNEVLFTFDGIKAVKRFDFLTYLTNTNGADMAMRNLYIGEGGNVLKTTDYTLVVGYNNCVSGVFLVE